MGIPKLHFVADGAPPSDADAAVFIAIPGAAVSSPFAKDIAAASALDASFASGLNVIASSAAAGNRLVYSPTGPLNRDQDDVRRVADAVTKGVKRAMQAGAACPILYLPEGTGFAEALLVALIAALGACYAPYSVRLAKGEASVEKVGTIYFTVSGSGVTPEQAQLAATRATAIEWGKRVAKDIGGSDPEIMAPPKAADYCVAAFAGLPNVSVSVISDVEAINKGYPLAAAVARASFHVPRHHPRIVRIEYNGCAPGATPEKQVYLVSSAALR